MTPGPRFSATTSASLIMRRAISLPFVGLQIDDRAALVAVEQQEEKAVDIRVVHVPQPPRPVAVRRPLDLDHIGPEPRQHLRAGRPGLVVREVDNANAFKRFGHLILPFLHWRPVRRYQILGKDLVERIGAFRSARTAPPRLRRCFSSSRARPACGRVHKVSLSRSSASRRSLTRHIYVRIYGPGISMIKASTHPNRTADLR